MVEGKTLPQSRNAKEKCRMRDGNRAAALAGASVGVFQAGTIRMLTGVGGGGKWGIYMVSAAPTRHLLTEGNSNLPAGSQLPPDQASAGGTSWRGPHGASWAARPEDAAPPL